jgi:hypothetical protein
MVEYRIVRSAPADEPTVPNQYSLHWRSDILHLFGWRLMGFWNWHQCYPSYEEAWHEMKELMRREAAAERVRNYKQQVLTRSKDIVS